MHNEDELATWIELHLDVRNVLGSEYNVVCPFHQVPNTRKPDLWINVEKAVFNCLSTNCGVRGHVAKLIAAVDGCTPEEAIRTLGRPTAGSLAKMLDQLTIFDHVEQPSLTNETIARYAQPHSFWEDREINEACRKFFQLGFDHEKKAATIPYLDRDGLPHSMILRYVEPVGGMKYHYPHGFNKDQAVFGLNLAHPHWPTLVVEGSIDMIRTYQNLDLLGDKYNVVSIFGSKVSDAQLQMLRHLDLILMFDPDPAGVQGQIDFIRRCPRLCGQVAWGNVAADPGSIDAPDLRRLLDHIEY